MKQLLRRSILLCLVLFFLPVVGEAKTDYSLRLKTKDFVPQEISNAGALSKSLAGSHIIIQFDGALDQTTRSQLLAEGIEILDYIPNFAYSAKISRTIDQTVADSYDIRWFGAIEPSLKIEPLLARNGVGDWARQGNGRAQFAVLLHRDEDAQALAAQLENDLQAEIIGFEPSTNAIDLIIPEAAYYRLAELDAVVWIKQANRQPKALMDKARVTTGTESLHGAPYNLSGAGTAVGVWDVGIVDALHPDLMGRIIIPVNNNVASHPTHVTGIVIGNGYESEGLYRGMAPQGKVVSYYAWGTTSAMSSQYMLSQSMYGAKTSNNSWGHGYTASPEECDEIMGAYTSECTSLDNIVRGFSSPPWVICWSAGNERSSDPDGCGGYGFTYRTIIRLASAKNVLTVGALDPQTDAMLYFSSWGPCKDGRIKPDVTAPGCMMSCSDGGGYRMACGTSMASPAVAGIVSLLRQQAETSFPSIAFSSAVFRGLIINGAKDLGRIGPDYEFGHGRVDAVNSVRKLLTGDSSFVEHWIFNPGDEHTYDLTVPSNTEELRITLVWDDWGAYTLTDIALVNDLDLAVIDPFGQEYYPWVLDPENPSQPATTGEDHLNVIETVSIMEPYPGLYTARVRGYNLPGGLQNYAIVFTPDAIHTPGNQRALAVFNSDDVEIDPGQSTQAEFWVTNVGTLTDSVTVHIEDDLGWISAVIDDELTLGQYDSAYFSVTATVPAEAMAWDESWISCTTISKTDGAINSTSRIAVGSSAHYGLAVAIPESDTVSSPQIVPIAVRIENTGNDYDYVSIALTSELEWTLDPIASGATLAPGTDTTFNFTVTVLAEEDHLANNLITIDVTSAGGVSQQPSLTLTVYNPYPPPQLATPSHGLYTQGRTFTFQWENAEADSFSLYIGTDQLMTDLRRSYRGFTQNSFTVPAADSLSDGGYYWAVRRYVGADSSSIQRYPHWLVVDNAAPTPTYPVYPMEDIFVAVTNLVFYFGYGTIPNGADIAEAPESYRLRVSNDSTFGANTFYYDIQFAPDFVMPDTLDQGPAYWSVKRLDLAGNETPWSVMAAFRLDSEAPAVPTLITPYDGSTAGGLKVTLSWSTDEPAPYDESPESYYLQMATDSNFYNVVYAAPQDSIHLTLPREDLDPDTQYYWRVRGIDSLGHQSSYQTAPFTFFWRDLVCGDVNGSGGTSISDITYLVDYLFGIPQGPGPVPFAMAGSTNGDHYINISDVTYLIEYLFGTPQGPGPICDW